MAFRRFEYIVVPAWPPLAWLGRCRTGSEVIEVFHGNWVETTKDWFCEAVWPGKFEGGDFDKTDIVAGSGGRAREGQVVFVSSGSTVDRLQSLSLTDEVLVSNSICCLLAWAQGTLDPSYPHYHRDFSSIKQGLSRYNRYLDSSAGQVELTYFDNLEWNGHKLSRKPKKETAPAFTSFTVYRDYLESTMRSVTECALAPARRQHIRPLCTVSNGYDSPTVAVIARNGGNCREALTFDVDRQGMDDSGATIAKHLDMDCTVIQRDAWRSLGRPEIPFIAGSPSSSDVLFGGAEPWLAGTVLFTGFHGDGVWSKKSKISNEQIADLVRLDGSGRSLTEFRLWANFIHCPVPFWGVRRGQELMAISRSPEMKEWDFTPPGGNSRPICRRILEEAGIPREAFGIGKRGVSVQLYRPETFLTPAAFQDYHEWLKKERGAWFRRGSVPPVPIIARGIDTMLTAMSWLLSWLAYRIPKRRGLGHIRNFCQKCVGKLRDLQLGVEDPPYLRRYTYAWGVERAKERYPSPPKDQVNP